MDHSIDSSDESPMELNRSMADADLELILGKAVANGCFSMLDFKNCNDADLLRLEEMIAADMRSVPKNELGKYEKKRLLFLAVSDELGRRNRIAIREAENRSDDLYDQIRGIDYEIEDLLLKKGRKA